MGEAEEVLGTNPKALPQLHENTGLPPKDAVDHISLLVWDTSYIKLICLSGMLSDIRLA